MISARHVCGLFALCVGVWLLLSGHTKPLLLGLGLASCLVTVGLALRMEIIDHESHPLSLSGKLFTYWFWLAGQILSSALCVIAAVISPRGRVELSTAKLPIGKRSDIGKVIYANSITLTPGTVSMRVEDDFIEVCSINRSNIASLEQGEMLRRVPDPGKTP